MQRESEPKEAGRKRLLRQTSLEDSFAVGSKRQRSIDENAEASTLEDIATGKMSVEPPMTCGPVEKTAEGSSETFNRREKMAAAAERRRSSQSPYSTPPHDAPPSPNSNPLAYSPESPSSADTPSTSSTENKRTSKSRRDATGNSSREPLAGELGGDKSARSLKSSDNIRSRVELPASATTKRDWQAASSDQETNFPQDESASTSHSYPCNKTRSKDKPSSSTMIKRDRQAASSVRKMPSPLADAGADMKEEENEAGLMEASPTLQYESSMLLLDSEPQSSQDDDEVQINKNLTRIEWRGVDITMLNRTPTCLGPLPKLQPSDDHTVLFRPHIRSGTPPRPYPDEYRDVWDTNYVRMPCSVENLYPVDDKNGKKQVQSRWELIEQTLLGSITNSLDLEEAILTYNARYCSKWNFSGLHHFFTEALDRSEANHFFAKLLPKMVQLALMLPKTCTQAIPLLKKQQTHTITLTQLQLASLLANAFFCTFPRRNAQQKKSEYSRFPDINFNRLFEGSSRNVTISNQRKVEKLKCVINYFRRVAMKAPTGTVSFTRRSLEMMPRWDKSQNELTRFHGNVYGMIEDEGQGLLQLDFANMYVGGGALGHGLVQEEIRFMICPELIASRLVTEVLDANECLVIKGAERFNDYTGYSNTFRWTGDYQDTIQRDSWGRKETEIVAIDALVFRRFEDQFKPALLRRELNKAFCGFYGNDTPAANLSAIATGNWGCGAFGGDARLKGLLQMMVAAECHRDVAYFTFGDQRLCHDLHRINEFLVSQAVTVGDLWLILQRYRNEVLNRPKRSKPNLYTFIYQVYSDLESTTDDDEAEETSEKKSDDGSLSPDYKVDTP